VSGRLAVIGGNSILGTPFAGDARRVDVTVAGTTVGLLDAGDHLVLQRHGLEGYRTAASIDHRAHLLALDEAGCDRILGLASVGSLRRDLAVGSMIAPDDFIALHLGLSMGDDARSHQVPAFDAAWRRVVLDTWAARTDVALADGGVYWQTIGPRFETPAEIRFIAAFADVVGMTAASECILAAEMGIPYAAVCTVDNFANGVADRALTVAEFEAGRVANQHALLGALEAVVSALAKAD
jgi:5'-methylthioadenosine phosphorylase